MPGKMIIKHCSPTLAGIKIGNMFSYAYKDEKQLLTELQEWNSVLNYKGIYFVMLRKKNKRALIYVYRKNQLKNQLQKKHISNFLNENGYITDNTEQCINCLVKRLTEKNGFPHEIGVFLDYPLEDIIAFIKNKGKNYRCVGHWKAYSNEYEAQKIFKKYNKCTNIYCKKHSEGFDIIRLTVAV